MNGARAAFLAGRREVRERWRSRAFRVSTVVQVLLVIAIVVVGSLVGGGGPQRADVGATAGSAAALKAAQRAQARAELEIEAHRVDGYGAARGRVAGGDLDAALVGRRLLIAEDAPGALQPLLLGSASATEIRGGLRRAGLGPARAHRILAASRVEPVPVPAGGGDDGQGIAFISTLLLYLAIIFCGYAVSSGVVEEKSTRVIELLLNAIRPHQLLTGKIVGIGLVGLAQLVAIVVAGLLAALLTGWAELPSATVETALLGLLYFVLGFALYGCAFAVAGSIVSRQEDLQSATSPLMIILIVGYLAAIAVIDSPGSTVAVILTMVPPAAPMIVPARAAAGSLPLPELVASVALMLAASAALVAIAGRIYERAVLRMGAPMRAREALRLLRSSS